MYNELLLTIISFKFCDFKVDVNPNFDGDIFLR